MCCYFCKLLDIFSRNRRNKWKKKTSLKVLKSSELSYIEVNVTRIENLRCNLNCTKEKYIYKNSDIIAYRTSVQCKKGRQLQI